MRKTAESFGIVHVDQISSTRGLSRTTSGPLAVDILLSHLFRLTVLRRTQNVSPQSESDVRYTGEIVESSTDW